MSALPNPRHERFAQLLVRGVPIGAAYVQAGFASHWGSASRLRRKPYIQARVAELMDHDAALAVVGVASLTERLLRIADAAEQAGGAPGLAVARAAVMDAARLNGLSLDKAPARPAQAEASAEPLPAAEAEAAWRAQVERGQGDDPP